MTCNCVKNVLAARVRISILGLEFLVILSLLHWNVINRSCNLCLSCERSHSESIEIDICWSATLPFLTSAVFVLAYTELRENTKVGGSSYYLHTEYDTLPRVGICNISEIRWTGPELASKNFKKCQSCENGKTLKSAISRQRSLFWEKCIREDPH